MLEQTESEVKTGGNEILVAVTEETAPAVERSLVSLAVDLARTREGGVRVAQFDERPDQTPLPGSADTSVHPRPPLAGGQFAPTYPRTTPTRSKA